jgi:plastocyanin
MRALPKIAVLLVALVSALVAAAAAGSAQRSVPTTMQLTIDITASNVNEAAQPANIAVRAGGTVTITFRNYTRLTHTFTMPALGISALIKPRHGDVAGVSHVTFVVPYGVYEWRCMFCKGSAHPHVHAMQGKVYAIINT